MPKIQQYLPTNIMSKSILGFPCLGSLPSRRSYFRCTAPIYLRCVLREWLSIMREETQSDNDLWYSLNMSKHYLKFQKNLYFNTIKSHLVRVIFTKYVEMKKNYLILVFAVTHFSCYTTLTDIRAFILSLSVIQSFLEIVRVT